MTDLPVDAFVSGDRPVTYVFADGRMVQLHGNHPYRDNNPGNLSYAGASGEARAKADGALTVDPTAPSSSLCSRTPSRARPRFRH